MDACRRRGCGRRELPVVARPGARLDLLAVFQAYGIALGVEELHRYARFSAFRAPDICRHLPLDRTFKGCLHAFFGAELLRSVDVPEFDARRFAFVAVA